VVGPLAPSAMIGHLNRSALLALITYSIAAGTNISQS